jgi:hypothetical protein
MGENAGEYYEHYFGRRRSVAQIIYVIEHVAGNGRLQAPTVPMMDKGLADDT